LAIAGGNLSRGVAAREPRHRGGDVDDRPADPASDHHDKAGARGNKGDKDQQCNYEAGTGAIIRGGQQLLGIVVKSVPHGDDGGEPALRLGKESVDIVLVLAAHGAGTCQLQFLAEAIDVSLLHPAQRRCNVAGRGGIAS
jgi:hypothetical protein